MNWTRNFKKTWDEISTPPKTVREFGFILAGVLVGFPLIGALLGMWLKGKSFHYGWYWPVLSALVLAVNFFLPRAMALIFRVAMFVAHGISWVVMRAVLALLFYLCITPITIAMRLMGRDLLDQKVDRNAVTYWKKRPPVPPREQYERMF